MRFPLMQVSTVSLCLAVSVAAAAPRETPPLMETITLWLVSNFDLPVPAAVPALVSVTEAELVAMRYGPGASVPPGHVAAVYDDPGRTIYVAEAWSGSTPGELSILVHEMVHHLQSAADMRFACPGEREVLAYRAQDAWLGLFGESLESAFGIDAATILVGTVCTH